MTPDPEMQDMLLAFADESREGLSEAEALLVGLEGRVDPETVQTVFRAMHSLKGSAGFLGLAHLQALAHEAEALLQQIRDGERPMDAAAVDLLCETLDLLMVLVDRVAAQWNDRGFEEEVASLCGRLSPRASARDTEGAAASMVKELDNAECQLFALDQATAPIPFLREAELAFGRVARWATDEISPTEALCRSCAEVCRRAISLGQVPDETVVLLVDAVDVMRELVGAIPDHAAFAEGAVRLLAMIEAARDTLPPSAPRLGDVLTASGHVAPEEIDRAVEIQDRGMPIGQLLVSEIGVPDAAVQSALNSMGVSSANEGRHETLRVDVAKLDALMDLVGELIIGTTAVIHNPRITEIAGEGFDKSAAQLDRITRALQDVAMSLRMTPVEKTFRRMTRLVRDVAHKRGRKVQLLLSGEDTEVDKSIVELIADPLVHLLRNAVDHGIESPADRRAAGKPEQGTVQLSARHQGGEVWITIQDDGRGLDKELIHRKAVGLGLTERPLGELSEREVFGFIFAPGFSTAGQITDISGRGVGMDVARRNLEGVNGRVDISSRVGEGTTVVLRIPLTLAIIEGMLVRVGQACFTVPMLQVKESVRVAERHLTVLHTGQEMVRIRHRLLPVMRLHRLYGIEDGQTCIDNGLMVVVEDDGEPYCLFVDELIGQRQTVIKSLSAYVGALPGISGCTVLGDGRISLILDVAALQRRSTRGVA